MSTGDVLSSRRRALHIPRAGLSPRAGLPPRQGRETLTVVGIAIGVAALAFAGMHKFGAVGILTPLAACVLVILLLRPLIAMSAMVGLTILCEGPTFGFLHFTSHLYDQVYKGLTPLDMLVAIAIAAVGLDIVGRRHKVRIPAPLLPATGVLLLAMLVGAVTGHGAGESLRAVVLEQHIIAYLLFLPTVIANMSVERRQVVILLTGLMVLAMVKAFFGLIEVAGGYGSAIEGASTLSYYEPTANWLGMIALLTVCAALAAKARLPRWVLLGSPLLLACLLLSYRRSFWIAAVLGLLLVIALGLSKNGRRVLLPLVVLVGIAVWLMGSVSVQSQSPIVKRVQSLSPSALEQNAQASYRLDERVDVLRAISENPITGIGLEVPWAAAARPLSVEHEGGRTYVHFAALWFWLKLGILGLVAYISFIVGSIVLSWRVWRASPEPLIRAFGLASLCGLVGLVVIETTASFTGVDPRFTALLAAQMGLLALLDRTLPRSAQPPLAGSAQPPSAGSAQPPSAGSAQLPSANSASTALV